MKLKSFYTSQKIILFINANTRLLHKETSIWLPFSKYEYSTNLTFQDKNMNVLDK